MCSAVTLEFKTVEKINNSLCVRFSDRISQPFWDQVWPPFPTRTDSRESRISNLSRRRKPVSIISLSSDARWVDPLTNWPTCVSHWRIYTKILSKDLACSISPYDVQLETNRTTLSFVFLCKEPNLRLSEHSLLLLLLLRLRPVQQQLFKYSRLCEKGNRYARTFEEWGPTPCNAFLVIFFSSEKREKKRKKALVEISWILFCYLGSRINNASLLKRLAVPTNETKSLTSRECMTCQKSNLKKKCLYRSSPVGWWLHFHRLFSAVVLLAAVMAGWLLIRWPGGK